MSGKLQKPSKPSCMMVVKELASYLFSCTLLWLYFHVEMVTDILHTIEYKTYLYRQWMVDISSGGRMLTVNIYGAKTFDSLTS